MAMPVDRSATSVGHAPETQSTQIHKRNADVAKDNGISLLDGVNNTIVRRLADVAPINGRIQEWRLRWYERVLQAAPDTIIN